MTDSPFIRSFTIYNAPYGHEMQLAIYDAARIDLGNEPSYPPYEEIGLYQNARTLIRIVPPDKDHNVEAPSVVLSDLQTDFEVENFLFYHDFFLCGRDRSVHHVELASVNKLFRIQNASNIFVGTFVYRVAGGDTDPSESDQSNWMGGIIRNMDGHVEGIVVRVSGRRVFTAKFSKDFMGEWSFEKPPKIDLTEAQKDELNSIREQAFFSQEEA